MKKFIEKILQHKRLVSAVAFTWLIIFLYLLQMALLPTQKKHELTRLTYADSLFITAYDTLNDQPMLTSLSRQIAFKKALLQISENDSINLVVNLHDSTVQLTINGVIIHTTIIQSFHVDPLFLHLSNMVYHKLFSQPLTIVEENATIVKEPIVIRQAPKNPEEAAINAYQPDTLIQNPAFLRMKLEHNIQIVFEQDTIISWEDKKTAFMFKLQYRMTYFINSLKSFISLKKQEYNPDIFIQMPVNELREIYRALPENSSVVIYYQ